jgi:hypothetical protein
MGVETLIAISAVSAGLQVASGFMQYSQQKKADKAAKNAANAQANIMQEDADRAALQETLDAEKARKTQKMAYLASGVDLSGSPLLVMEETRAKGEENAKNIKDRGYAQAAITRAQGSVGRASLVGSLSDTVSGLSNTYTNYAMVNKQVK